MNTEKLYLSSPWVSFYHEIDALFKEDPQIKVVFDDDKNEVKLFVDNQEKAEALKELLPVEKNFSGVILKITIIPANKSVTSKVKLYNAAFDGNPALSYIKTVRGLFTNDLNYVVFKNKVVQYFNDDLGDVNGLKSTLYQDIAKDVFEETDGIFFCTDLPKSVDS